MSRLLRGHRLRLPIALAAAAAIAATGVVATAARPPAPRGHAKVVLQFWNAYNATDTEASTMAKVVIPRFEKAYPWITVHSDVYPYSALLPKLLASTAAGNPPDLVRSDIIWVPQLAKLGALVPLSTQMPGFAAVAKTTFPGPLSTCLWKGTYYGLPLDTNTQVLFWNRSNFAAAGISGPPTTLTQLYADARKLTVPSKHHWGLGVDGTDIWNVGPYIWSAGGNFTNPGLTSASKFINGPAMVRTVDQLVSLYRAGVIGDDFRGGTGVIGGETGFPKGQYAMYIDGPWGVATYAKAFPHLAYGMSLFPAGPGGSVSTVGGEDIVIPKGSRHHAAAELFATFLDSPWAQLTMAKTGQLGAVASAAPLEIKADPYYRTFLQQLRTARARTPVPQYTQIDTDFVNALQAILGGAKVKPTLDALTSTVNGLLAQNGG